jgi:transcription antitermination factor NusG
LSNDVLAKLVFYGKGISCNSDSLWRRDESPVQWYLLKTWVGREAELIKEIRRTVPPYMYGECFVIRQERIWRKQQRSVVHVEPLFPGCVFLTCRETGQLFKRLEQIPSMAGLMAHGSLTVLPMMKEDVDFLTKISGPDHMVRLSYVTKNEQGQICNMSDPLKACQGQIERYQFKKRYAMVRHWLWGEEQAIVMGIILKEDAERKLLYENMEVSVEIPEMIG